MLDSVSVFPASVKEQCRTGKVALDAFFKESEGFGRKLRGVLGEGPFWDVNYYFACKAAVSGQPDACAGLPVEEPGSPQECGELSRIAEFLWAVAGHGDAMPACRSYLKYSLGKKVPDDLDRVCGAYASAFQKGDPGELCSVLKSGAVGEDHQRCMNAQAWLSGRSEDCKKRSGQQGVSQRCLMLAGLTAALRSGEKSACSAVPFCGALSSQAPGACAAYLKEPVRQLCERVKTGDIPTEKAHDDAVKQGEGLRRIDKQKDEQIARKLEAERLEKAKVESEERAKKGSKRGFKKGQMMWSPEAVVDGTYHPKSGKSKAKPAQE